MLMPEYLKESSEYEAFSTIITRDERANAAYLMKGRLRRGVLANYIHRVHEGDRGCAGLVANCQPPLVASIPRMSPYIMSFL